MSDSAPTATRRGLLAGLGTAAAVGVVPAVTAQGGGKFTSAAVPDSAPTFDGDDYVGLFVHIAGPGESGGSEEVDACEFAGGSEELVTWDAMLVDETGENARETTTLHAKQGADGMQGGHLFVVNDQQDCGDGVVQLTLEQVGSSEVAVQTGTASGDGATTSTEIPGFGPVAGVASLLGAGWLATRRDEE